MPRIKSSLSRCRGELVLYPFRNVKHLRHCIYYYPHQPVADITTMIHVSFVYSSLGITNFNRRSTTGITFPRRFMMPLQRRGLRDGVMSITPIISLTFSISRPYSSLFKTKVRYFLRANLFLNYLPVFCGHRIFPFYLKIP